MTKETVSGPGNPVDALVPTAAMLNMVELSVAPLIIGTAWWTHMMQVYLPEPPLARALAKRPVRHDPHAQLVVPEPLEAGGEHGLLA